ncbi:MAG: Glutamine cyclotransferase [Caulobacteraceae bacterium]|nr:Glutamine cyclotransferase [Caulobacteraceae bacterium]
MRKGLWRTLILGALGGALIWGGAAHAATPVYGYKIVHIYPHDPDAFTEGLFYLDGFLYESTGLEGRSSIRKVKLETGEVVQQRPLDAQYFGEGIVAWAGRLVELTWQSQIGFVYDLKTFAPRSSFRYRGEGWALTRDDHRLIMSDGTPDLRFLDPRTLKETGRLTVTDGGKPVPNLNELEWVKGQIYANIWQANRIARIDPKSGHVLGWIDLTDMAIVEGSKGGKPIDVLNGIAYDAAHDRLFVTGKLWPDLYEIKLTATAGR